MNIRSTRFLFAGRAFSLFLTIVFVLFVLPAHSVAAQQHHRVASDEFRITFPVNKSVLDRKYRDNAQAFALLDSLLAIRGQMFVDSVIVVSKSSPEGAFRVNESLSVRRSRAVYDYVVGAYPELADKVKISSEVESWAEFAQMVSEDPSLTYNSRATALAIIDSNVGSDAKKAQLRRMKEYKYFLNDYFPALRFSAIVVVFDRVSEVIASLPTLEELSFEDFPQIDTRIELPEERLVIPVLQGRRTKRTLLALKTNLLYDAVTALNFEVEVPIGSCFSIMVEDVFPWWETGNKWCFQMWEIGVEGRFWFRRWDPRGTEKLRGLFVGPYVMSSMYDFQLDRKLNYQGEYWSAGVSAGYAVALGRKNKKWGTMEFSLSAGYLQTDYRHYLPTESYDKLIRDRYRVGKASYFGPTKAKVSLVIPINVYNSMKGSRHE